MEHFLGLEDALRFVQECERTGTRILGVEFFEGDESAYTPRGGTAWDSIAAEPAEQSWREARDLLKDGIPNGANLVVFTTDAMQTTSSGFQIRVPTRDEFDEFVRKVAPPAGRKRPAETDQPREQSD